MRFSSKNSNWSSLIYITTCVPRVITGYVPTSLDTVKDPPALDFQQYCSSSLHFE